MKEKIVGHLGSDRRPPEFISIVSGLPRSGTSMMMRILSSGGLEVVTDQKTNSDEDNPGGYFEFEMVRKLKDGEIGWIKEVRGKGLKVTSSPLEYLPGRYQYKVIFMEREMAEVLASRRQMLIRRGESPKNIHDNRMAESFYEHLKRVRVWLANQPNMEVLYVDYNDLMRNPVPSIERVRSFLGVHLDFDAMCSVPDRRLYRQHK